MKNYQKLPLGVENFVKIRTEDFYYIDKTKLIEQLLTHWSEVTLFTRPRRFGKSLNMSMLRSFFEIGTSPALFDGLYISQNRELCEKNMGKYPVISISLKGINAAAFRDAKSLLGKVINEEARRLQFLEDSPKLSDTDKELFRKLLKNRMSIATLSYSLRELSELLEKHFEEKVVILIDEYDVPLAKASENGYYDEMILLIRSLFENALKTNNSLKLAVLTGCLRVAKDSIFTGLNNFKVYSITDVAFDEYFGFTDIEVRKMLDNYDLMNDYMTIKEWYDGYRFGNINVYCPWDVLNYCSDHLADPCKSPQNYWANTSGNNVIYHFIDSMSEQQQLTKAELERLVNGDIIQKEINQELTYKELYTSMDNLWSTLFMTGYLTQRETSVGNRYNLAVPNLEIRNLITEHILTQFKQSIAKDGLMANDFCNALLEARSADVEKLFTQYMAQTISIRDTFVQKPLKENFYHGILLGILSYKEGWIIKSNCETGDGFSDILIQIDESDTGILIEVKYAEIGTEERTCQTALKQISDKNYSAALRQQGFSRILKYGIACNKKRCCVLLEMK